jgi:PilZ domain-containing protein
MEVRCPRCGKDFVRLVRREGLAEIVASAVCLYPFACQLCAHRFRAFQWGVSSTAQSSDQRRYERVQVSFPLLFSTNAGFTNGAALDVSLCGCAFKTEPAPAPGTIVQLKLQAPGLERPLVVDAAVVRSVRSVYVGSEFLRLRPEEQYRLTQFVASMLTARRITDDATSQAGRPRETDSLSEMR